MGMKYLNGLNKCLNFCELKMEGTYDEVNMVIIFNSSHSAALLLRRFAKEEVRGIIFAGVAIVNGVYGACCEDRLRYGKYRDLRRILHLSNCT